MLQTEFFKIDFFNNFLQKKLIKNKNFNLIEVHTKTIYVQNKWLKLQKDRSSGFGVIVRTS